MIVQIYIDYWNFNNFFALFLLAVFNISFIRSYKNTGDG